MFDELIIFLGLLAIGYFVGAYVEKTHYASLQRRERQTRHLIVLTCGAKQPLPAAQEAALFVGSATISLDYFRSFVASLYNLVGGRIGLYEKLLDRGRREAMLRMKEQAIAWGANQMVNVRLETSDIGSYTGNKIVVEVIAYGTGIR